MKRKTEGAVTRPSRIENGAKDRTRASADLSIQAYMHCKMCIEELPKGISPQEFSRLDIGWSADGFQVWCFRHNVNVMHVDFEGMTHPAKLAAVQSPQTEPQASTGTQGEEK